MLRDQAKSQRLGQKGMLNSVQDLKTKLEPKESDTILASITKNMLLKLTDEDITIVAQHCSDGVAVMSCCSGSELQEYPEVQSQSVPKFKIQGSGIIQL